MTTLTDWVGKTQTLADIVAPASLTRFFATIDAPPSETPQQGFHWCVCLPDTPTGELGIDGHPPKGGFLPPAPLPRRMWAGSEVEFFAPLMLGAAIERVSTVKSVKEKTGGSGSLVFVEVGHETLSNGALAVRETQTIVYREATTARAPLPPVTSPDLSAWDWTRTVTPNAAMLFRFSAITFNTHRIHYDLPYAQNEEFYPGLVVHGPLMATLLLDHCARRFGPNALAKFSYKASQPAFCDQPLHLAGRGDKEIELNAIGGDGRVVVTASAVRA